MKKYTVTLSEDERKTLGDLASKGTQKSQKILNALILLGCDEGEYQTGRSTNEEIAWKGCWTFTSVCLIRIILLYAWKKFRDNKKAKLS